MIDLTSFKKSGLFAFFAVATLGAALFAQVGCGGSGGGTRDITVRIDWNMDEDLDLEVSRNDGNFGDADNISVFNPTGGPPPWGQHLGDDQGGGGFNFEIVEFVARESDEPYDAYAHGFDITFPPITVRCRVWYDNEQNPRIDDTYSIDHDEVIHFARIRRNGTTVPPGDVVIKVEKRRTKAAKGADSPKSPAKTRG
ncbi:MAG: hypothetical protein ACR2HJ_06655 [Fimbriimonadales bacterium]